MPAVARQHTHAGAVAFARYWVETLDWADATMDTKLARTGFETSCSECELLVEAIDAARSKGDHMVGGRASIHEASIVVDAALRQFVVDVSFSIAANIVVDAAGKTISRQPAVPSWTYRLWLSWVSSHWYVIKKTRVVQ
jgi:hypothetical protein